MLEEEIYIWLKLKFCIDSEHAYLTKFYYFMQIIDLQIKPVNNFNGIIVQVKYQLQGTKNNYKCLSLYLILIHAILF